VNLLFDFQDSDSFCLNPRRMAGEVSEGKIGTPIKPNQQLTLGNSGVGSKQFSGLSVRTITT